MNPEKLTKLLIDEVRDLYHAEKQLLRALPKMAKAAESQSLRQAMEEHLAQTEEQVGRLEKVFELLDTPAKAKPCKGMQGLLEEGAEMLGEEEKGAIRDLAIIGSAQRVEHYEISAYGTARAIAEQIGNAEVAALLEETENEEKAADERLSEIAGEIYEMEDSEDEEEEAVAGRGNSRARGASNRS